MISLKLPACTHLGEGSVKTVPEMIPHERTRKRLSCSPIRACGSPAYATCCCVSWQMFPMTVLDDIPREPSYLDVEKIAAQLEAVACDLIVADRRRQCDGHSEAVLHSQGRALIPSETCCRTPRGGASR